MEAIAECHYKNSENQRMITLSGTDNIYQDMALFNAHPRTSADGELDRDYISIIAPGSRIVEGCCHAGAMQLSAQRSSPMQPCSPDVPRGLNVAPPPGAWMLASFA